MRQLLREGESFQSGMEMYSKSGKGRQILGDADTNAVIVSESQSRMSSSEIERESEKFGGRW